MLVLIIVFVYLLYNAAGIFLTQPSNITVTAGEQAVIPCRLSEDRSRRWVINGQVTTETNLTAGLNAIQAGLLISGDYSLNFNQTSFQCFVISYIGPPEFLSYTYSSIGILTVSVGQQQPEVTAISNNHPIISSSIAPTVAATMLDSSNSNEYSTIINTAAGISHETSSALSTSATTRPHSTSSDTVEQLTRSSFLLSSSHSVFASTFPNDNKTVSGNGIVIGMAIAIAFIIIILVTISLIVILSAISCQRRRKKAKYVYRMNQIQTNPCSAYGVIETSGELEKNRAYETVAKFVT